MKAIEATVELTKLALSILPDIPQNLRRPFVDISAAHLSRWYNIHEEHEWASDPKEH